MGTGKGKPDIALGSNTGDNMSQLGGLLVSTVLAHLWVSAYEWAYNFSA